MANNDDQLILLKKMSDQMDHQSELSEKLESCVNKLDKKLDLHIQKMEYELKGINQLDAVQNDLLDKHIEGVNTLKKIYIRHEDMSDKRFDKLEDDVAAPRIWLKNTIKIAGAIGTLAGAIYTIGRITGKF